MHSTEKTKFSQTKFFSDFFFFEWKDSSFPMHSWRDILSIQIRVSFSLSLENNFVLLCMKFYFPLPSPTISTTYIIFVLWRKYLLPTNSLKMTEGCQKLHKLIYFWELFWIWAPTPPPTKSTTFFFRHRIYIKYSQRLDHI